MATRQVGDRFRLLLYERMISRYRGFAITLAILQLVLWYLVSRGIVSWPQPPADGWLLAGGLVSIAYWLLTQFGPYFAYAQPRVDHLRVQTPIYRLKISYRRIISTRPIDFAKMFPPESVSRRDRKHLEPFFGLTAFGVDLRGWPLPLNVLRLFLNQFSLANDLIGIVFLVEDWMALSNQLSSRMDSWRVSRQQRPRGPGIGASEILRD